MACEDGWSDYHEETEETDSFEVALAWLRRSDTQQGEIRFKGKVVASKDRDGSLEFASGWCSSGLKALVGA